MVWFTVQVEKWNLIRQWATANGIKYKITIGIEEVEPFVISNDLGESVTSNVRKIFRLGMEEKDWKKMYNSVLGEQFRLEKQEREDENVGLS